MFKGRDDLRQDAVMQQVFGVVNKLLTDNTETKSLNLTMRTYKVLNRLTIFLYLLSINPACNNYRFEYNLLKLLLTFFFYYGLSFLFLWRILSLIQIYRLEKIFFLLKQKKIYYSIVTMICRNWNFKYYLNYYFNYYLN